MFQSLPKVFNKIPGGDIIGAVFFLLVFFAAFTSSISLMETVISIVDDKLHLGRKKVCLIVFIGALILGLPSTLGNGIWSAVKVAGLGILDMFDFLANNVLMPIVALCTCIFVGLFLKTKSLIEEIELTGPFKAKNMFTVIIKYIAPVCIVIILVSSILNGLGIIKI